MNYIIWGTGQRGTRISALIGDGNIVAYIEGNSDKWGDLFRGKPVVSVDDALLWEDCMIVITPVVASDEIEQELLCKGVHTYFRLDDFPTGFSLEENAEDGFGMYSLENTDYRYGLYGITLFSLLLADYYKMHCEREMILYPQEGISGEILAMISQSYQIGCIGEAQDRVDKVIVVKRGFEEEVTRHNKLQMDVMEVDAFLEENISFFNDKILAFKDRHKGERCFIVATGPSLTVDDLDVLHTHGEVCISMNRIYNIFNRTAWRPDYYVIEDVKMIEDLSEEIANLDLENKFVSAVPASYWELDKAQSSIRYNMIVQNYETVMPGFATNVERCVYNGRTVTYVCLQLAAYMGVSEIYLLGVDFNYKADIYAAENHFKGYQDDKKNVRLNPIFPEKMLLAYQRAKQYGLLHNINIYNATRGGKLEMFPRVDFDTLFD